jgi:hypothetical protein
MAESKLYTIVDRIWQIIKKRALIIIGTLLLATAWGIKAFLIDPEQANDVRLGEDESALIRLTEAIERAKFAIDMDIAHRDSATLQRIGTKVQGGLLITETTGFISWKNHVQNTIADHDVDSALKYQNEYNQDLDTLYRSINSNDTVSTNKLMDTLAKFFMAYQTKVHNYINRETASTRAKIKTHSHFALWVLIIGSILVTLGKGIEYYKNELVLERAKIQNKLLDNQDHTSVQAPATNTKGRSHKK